MVDCVVTFLLEYLCGLLKDEANLLAGVEDKVNSLIGELSLINIFLKNSEGKQNDDIVKEIVRQIREVANQAENVIDNFIQKVMEQRSRTAIGRIFHSASHTKMLRDVGMKIVGIKERINEIYNNKERYGIERVETTVNAFEEEPMHRFRREVEEDDVVGFVHDSTKVMEQLTKWDPKLDVISIIGMGGLGKTTLARKIYNNLRVMQHFDCHVWVCVSEHFTTRDLLLKILKELGITLEDMIEEKRKKKGKEVMIEVSEDELKEEIFRCLQGRRYLVVMDDIWRTEVWDRVRSAFPDNSNRSRILITSRNKEVASHASLTPHYRLPVLNKDESWELFRKKVFRRETCPLELETLGRQIAEGCKGLPLSIVVLAGVLANKEKSPHIWSRFVGHVTSFLTSEDDTTICREILFLSYTDLPWRLKLCFLYFGLYPQDFEIPVRPLMHMWVAEGFTQHTSHRFPEDVAEMYLEKLIDRSLIQVASERTDGGVRTCRIHDLLREICIREGAEAMFLDVHSDNRSSAHKSRRLSIQGNDAQLYMSLNPYVHSNARSLFFFSDAWHDCSSMAWVQRNFKFLRVLYFEDSISLLPNMATFIHLKYMKISYKLVWYPRVMLDFIGNLINLETLYVTGFSRLEGYLSKELFKLQRLRNLYLSNGLMLPCDSEEALGNLQVLSVARIKYDPQKRSFPVVLDKFPNLRKLKILIKGSWKEIGEAEEIVSFPSVEHLAHLEILRIQNCGMLPRNLNLFPSRITKLTLTGVEKVGDYVTVVGKLRDLRILKLEFDHFESFLEDKRVHVIADSFPQLQVLKLSYLRIVEWKQERGAMPSLRHLVISCCDEWTSAPELLSLTTLRSVEVIRSPRLATMLRELQTGVGVKLLISNTSLFTLAEKR